MWALIFWLLSRPRDIGARLLSRGSRLDRAPDTMWALIFWLLSCLPDIGARECGVEGALCQLAGQVQGGSL
ncbi:hypothetical protein I79_013170 [Cricetulus griseus]|uniref:Uncharacterized protein n=1 Tax=Cricetulus griseus TaxID=10029 RepID=G3HQR4_CRIGR|nr:hypothetical protein I79_013170 [Cricetulus griseus]